MTGLTFSYDSVPGSIFDHVDLTLDTDWKLGLIGRNGKGKTTLLKLFMGEYEYSGRISSSVNFTYFPFEVSDSSGTSFDIAEVLSDGAERWRVERELSLMDADTTMLDRPFRSLSMGEQTKLMLSCMFLRENGFLLIDEPTNHLDALGRETVSRYLNRKKGFIVVSHDRAFLDGCVDHILSINRATIELMKGNYSDWEKAFYDRQSREEAENRRLEGDIDRLEQAARREAGWAKDAEKTKKGGKDPSGLRPDRGYVGHKSAKLMKRVKNLEARQNKAIEEKKALLKDRERDDELMMVPREFYRERLLYLDDVDVAYSGKTVAGHISFELNRGERILLSGPNGSGKSTLMRLILGEDIPHTGIVNLSSQLIISYLPQQFLSLKGSLRDMCNTRRIDETLVSANLSRMGVDSAAFSEDMGSYSDGMKKKVLLALSISEEADVYIWDEPLNYIDVITRSQIERMILRYRPAMIFSEHDRLFCERIATKTVETGK